MRRMDIKMNRYLESFMWEIMPGGEPVRVPSPNVLVSETVYIERWVRIKEFTHRERKYNLFLIVAPNFRSHKNLIMKKFI